MSYATKEDFDAVYLGGRKVKDVSSVSWSVVDGPLKLKEALDTALRVLSPQEALEQVLADFRIDRERRTVRFDDGFYVVSLRGRAPADLYMTLVAVMPDDLAVRLDESPMPPPVDHAALAYRARRGWR